MRVRTDTHCAPLLGLHQHPGANTYYRLTVPLGAAGGAVAPLLEAPVSQVAAAETVVISNFGALPGHDDAAAGTVRALQAEGKRVLLDYDDALRDVPAAYRVTTYNYAAQKRAARQADGLVCTNPLLAERLRRLNPDVRVLPNLVRLEDWPPPPPPADGPPVVTLTGSASHEADWAIVREALATVKRRHPFTLRVAGHLPRYLRGLVDDHRPWTGDLAAYPAMLAGTTIGLCPLQDTPFNRCKTPIKAYEFALSGAAVIGSPTQYGPVLADGRGLVCRTPDAWAAALTHYLADAATRAASARALLAFVQGLDARQHLPAIRAAYAA